MTKIQQHAKWLGLLSWAFIFLVLALAFSGCAAHKQHGPPPPEAERISRADTTGRPPAGVVVQPPQITPPAQAGPQAGAQKGFLGHLFGSKTASAPPKTQYLAGAQPGPRKCKGCTFNIVAGDQSNVGKKATAAVGDGASAVVAGKKSGPIVQADSGAKVNIAASKQGPAAAGEGIEQHQTTVKPPTPWLKYGLWALGAVGGYWLLFGGGGVLLLALFRRNKSNPNQV